MHSNKNTESNYYTNRNEGDNNSSLIINICKWGIYIQNNSEIQSFQLFSVV
jgi:hypothetical protein